MIVSTKPLLFILLLVVSASFYALVKAEGGFTEVPRLLEKAGVPMPKSFDIGDKIPDIDIPRMPTSTPTQGTKNSSVPPEFQSGNSRFSQGSCSTDADCVQAGCSGEVCSNDPDVISTCEFSESFPNVQGYSCGCVNTVCGWK